MELQEASEPGDVLRVVYSTRDCPISALREDNGESWEHAAPRLPSLNPQPDRKQAQKEQHARVVKTGSLIALVVLACILESALLPYGFTFRPC